jgi:hypothetical protein
MPSVNELETAKEMVNEVARIQLECCTSIDKWEWSNVADVENAKVCKKVTLIGCLVRLPVTSNDQYGCSRNVSRPSPIC